MQNNNKGFKPSTCSDRRCLACTPTPPNLTLSQIKKMGTEFCMLDENVLSEKALNQERKKANKSVIALKENKKQEEANKKKKKK